MDAHGSALVTGASRGIGRAVALELAARGFSVIATMRDPSAGDDLVSEAAAALRAGVVEAGVVEAGVVEAGEAGTARGALTVRGLDVTDPGVIDVPDDLRVLVNNAGFQDGYLPVETVPLDLLRSMFETNVVGQVAVLQQVIPVMRRRREGVLCTITSSSILLASPFFAAYRASKAAMSAVCESMLVELAPFGIRVVEVLPGPVDTDGLAHAAYVPAVELPAYRDQAARMMASRQRITEIMVSPASAAVRIVDTILDDDAPLRSASDPMGDALLEAWRHTPDDELLARALARYAVP